jgi:hypothetical protein
MHGRSETIKRPAVSASSKVPYRCYFISFDRIRNTFQVSNSDEVVIAERKSRVAATWLIDRICIPLDESLVYGTDKGPRCRCGSTVFGYGVTAAGRVVVQCIDCHSLHYIDCASAPNTAKEFLRLHRQQLRNPQKTPG